MATQTLRKPRHDERSPESIAPLGKAIFKALDDVFDTPLHKAVRAMIEELAQRHLTKKEYKKVADCSTWQFASIDQVDDAYDHGYEDAVQDARRAIEDGESLDTLTP